MGWWERAAVEKFASVHTRCPPPFIPGLQREGVGTCMEGRGD